MDKWFTDLAAHAGVDNVTVSYWPTHTEPAQVGLWVDVGPTRLFEGDGRTIEEAMTAALAKLRTTRALEELASIDAELIGEEGE